MTQTRIDLERTFFLAAFLLALFVRFLNLGAAPLSDTEANWALQAWNVANASGLRSQVSIGPQPAYIFSTALLFSIFGSTNFLARFWPALAGSLLVLAPFLLRRRIGGRVALIAAFGLALDPGLTTVSRQAGSPMMALAFTVLALAFWMERRPIFAGVLAALALLSGPMLYNGLLGLGAAWLAFNSVQKLSALEPAGDIEQAPGSPAILRRKALLAAGLTILLIGTYFLRYPQGLAAWAQSLVVYLRDWTTASGVNALKTLVALAIYQPFALLFAILGIARWLITMRRESASNQALYFGTFVWLLVTLAIILLYPSRLVSSLVWLLVPLWLLAAFELEKALPVEASNLVSLLQAALILVLGVLFWITMVSTGKLSAGAGVQIALLFGILLLGMLTTLLVALGWSAEISRLGTIWGVTFVSAFYLISTMWGASQLRPNQPEELWSPLPGTGQAGLMQTTLNDLSNWNTGLAKDIDILSIIDAPSLRWMLRTDPNVHFSPVIPPGDMPAIVITPMEKEPTSLAAAYRGQDFVWRTWPDWQGTLPPDKLDWLTFREAPIKNEKIILWARVDQFPGGQLGSQESNPVAP